MGGKLMTDLHRPDLHPPNLHTYELYAIRYGHNPNQRASANFLGGDPHDLPMPLDYFVWAIKGPQQTFVLDTGFDARMGEKRQRQFLRSPGEGLKMIGVDPDAITDVIVSHMHYDHCGNYGLFPRARYHLQDREMAYCTGRCICHPALRMPFEVEDVIAMVRNVFDGRVVFHDGAEELAPGLSLHHVGGHSKGLQVVRVWTRRGWMVLASDASHFYANMEQGRAFPIIHNLEDTLEGYGTLRKLASHPANIIPGHDPLVLRRYPAPSSSMEGAVVRLDADPLD
jgi:glyoxylase-like metal-dependent hydrolase (beta-lactamase superfamily II)